MPIARYMECCSRLATLLAGLAAGGCATVSPQQERQIGRKEAQEVESAVGLVRERRVVEYVETIGTRLARVTGRTDITWQWSVADDGDANAFALPGGWVYVTRGLLVLANREDEMAGVLAHEMAHVIERHATHRVGAATLLAVLFSVPAGLLGIVSPGLGEIVGGGRPRRLRARPGAIQPRAGAPDGSGRRRIFRVVGACGGADWERYRGEFERTTMSCRPLRPPDQVRITESRLRICSARAGERIAQVLARGGATWSPAQAAVANGVAPERPLEPDWPVKVAVSGPYRPAERPTPGQR